MPHIRERKDAAQAAEFEAIIDLPEAAPTVILTPIQRTGRTDPIPSLGLYQALWCRFHPQEIQNIRNPAPDLRQCRRPAADAAHLAVSQFSRERH